MGEEGAIKGEDTVEEIRRMSGYGGDVIAVGGFPTSESEIGCGSESESESESDLAAAEIMIVWAIQGPTSFAPNALVSQSSLELRLDACGHSLSILQSPCSLSTPGVTGSVMWDSGVVLGKFLEHSVDSKDLSFEGKKIVELGSGCGLVGCIAALLGGNVVLTDLPDRLRLLKKNIQTNLHRGDTRGSATVEELVWGDDPDPDLIAPFPDYVLGSDVIYSEEAVHHLIKTLLQLSGDQTTIFLAGELRNDAVLEYFLESALKDFAIGRVEQTQWHPEYRSRRVVLYVLEKKSKRGLADDSSLNQSC
uniref:Protein-lysine methyltransferase METTL21D n=1 Tax=Noccaea caerulescens TaxID=107243 RepID=A0A1J3D991_NOCCA